MSALIPQETPPNTNQGHINRRSPGDNPASILHPGDTIPLTTAIRPPTRVRNTHHLTLSLGEGSESTAPQDGAAPPAGTSVTNAGTSTACVVPSEFQPGRKSEIRRHHTAVGVGLTKTLGRMAEIRFGLTKTLGRMAEIGGPTRTLDPPLHRIGVRHTMTEDGPTRTPDPPLHRIGVRHTMTEDGVRPFPRTAGGPTLTVFRLTTTEGGPTRTLDPLLHGIGARPFSWTVGGPPRTIDPLFHGIGARPFSWTVGGPT